MDEVHLLCGHRNSYMLSGRDLILYTGSGDILGVAVTYA